MDLICFCTLRFRFSVFCCREDLLRDNDYISGAVRSWKGHARTAVMFSSIGGFPRGLRTVTSPSLLVFSSYCHFFFFFSLFLMSYDFESWRRLMEPKKPRKLITLWVNRFVKHEFRLLDTRAVKFWKVSAGKAVFGFSVAGIGRSRIPFCGTRCRKSKSMPREIFGVLLYAKLTRWFNTVFCWNCKGHMCSISRCFEYWMRIMLEKKKITLLPAL